MVGNETDDDEPTSAAEFTWLPHPSFDELEAGLHEWEEQVPDRLTVESVGESREGRSMIAAIITDASADDTGKQHVLFTASHSGQELNGCTGLLHFVKWLIGDDPDAARYRQRYRVVVMPCVDPDGYATDPPHISTPSPYTAWTWNGPDEDVPEAVAVYEVMERLQPDAHMGIHGIGFAEGQMWESTGISWAASLSRAFEPGVMRFIDDEAEERGFLITRGERDAGQLRATDPVDGAEEHFYGQAQGRNIFLFSYNRYHTLAFTSEAGFDDSVVVRARALLKAGLREWRYQDYRGVPVDHVKARLGTQLAAWGETPRERRASRVELWQNLRYYGVGGAHPEHRGTIGAVVAFTPDGADRLGSHDPSEGFIWKTDPLPAILDRLASEDRFEVDALREWDAARPLVPDGSPWPAGLYLHGPTETEGATTPPENGAVIRLLIPYRNAKLKDITLDGRPLEASRRDGYTVSRDPGCVVRVAIPPGEVRDLHIATCTYDPGEERRAGFTPEDWSRS